MSVRFPFGWPCAKMEAKTLPTPPSPTQWQQSTVDPLIFKTAVNPLPLGDHSRPTCHLRPPSREDQLSCSTVAATPTKWATISGSAARPSSCVYRHKTVSEREQDVTQGLVAINVSIYINAITKSDPGRAGVDAVAIEPNRAVISTELFNRAQVQDVAKRIHGGGNGIDAACSYMKKWERRRSSADLAFETRPEAVGKSRRKEDKIGRMRDELRDGGGQVT